MKTLIIACNTIVEELNMACIEVKCEYPILWIESGLHTQPCCLKKRLQGVLNSISNVDQVLLAFGFCGNSSFDLKPPSYKMIFPKVDDCISLLLGSREKRNDVSGEMSTYFLTKGWLNYERNIWVEYQQAVRQYGQIRADRIFHLILGHYKRLGVIDTGAYNFNDIVEKTNIIADVLKLKHQVIPGTLRYIKKLLTGPWDEEFVVINPGQTVTVEDMCGGTTKIGSNNLNNNF